MRVYNKEYKIELKNGIISFNLMKTIVNKKKVSFILHQRKKSKFKFFNLKKKDQMTIINNIQVLILKLF